MRVVRDINDEKLRNATLNSLKLAEEHRLSLP